MMVTIGVGLDVATAADMATARDRHYYDNGVIIVVAIPRGRHAPTHVADRK